MPSAAERTSRLRGRANLYTIVKYDRSLPGPDLTPGNRWRAFGRQNAAETFMSTLPETESLVLGPEHNGLMMTPEEFDAIEEYDDLYRYELIHGVLVVNPISSQEERDPNEELGYLLRNYRDAHPQGSCLDATLFEEYVRTPGSRRRADRLIWVGLRRLPDPRADTPSVVVEFVSPGRRSWRRDYIEKRDEYLALGVLEYWVIDRFRRTLTVFCKSLAGFEEVVVSESEIYRPLLLPGFELPLARLLALADRWQAG
jgi:Uma2 family endonuclease